MLEEREYCSREKNIAYYKEIYNGTKIIQQIKNVVRLEQKEVIRKVAML